MWKCERNCFSNRNESKIVICNELDCVFLSGCIVLLVLLAWIIIVTAFIRSLQNYYAVI